MNNRTAAACLILASTIGIVGLLIGGKQPYGKHPSLPSALGPSHERIMSECDRILGQYLADQITLTDAVDLVTMLAEQDDTLWNAIEASKGHATNDKATTMFVGWVYDAANGQNIPEDRRAMARRQWPMILLDQHLITRTK